MKKKSEIEAIQELGQESVAFLNELKVETAVLPLDYILAGGIKERGDIIQIAGESMTGKTTLALQIVNKYCKLNKKVIYIDTNNNVDANIIERFKLKDYLQVNFLFYKCITFEEMSKVIDTNLNNNHIDLIIIDSLAGAMNKGYFNIQGKKIDVENNNSNYDSRPLSLFIRKYADLSYQYGYSMILVNEIRNRIHKKLGTINKRYGPKTLDYSCSTILELKKSKNNRFGDHLEQLNYLAPMEFEIVKCNSCLKLDRIPLLFNKAYGVDVAYSAINELIRNKKVMQSGGYYTFGNLKVQGLEPFISSFPKDDLKSAIENQKQLIIKYYNNEIK